MANDGQTFLTLGTALSCGGFCLDTTANHLPDGHFAGLFEVDFRNPGGEWVRQYDPGLWMGTAGIDKGRVCWCPAPDFDQEHTFFKGIQSGAEIRARQLNFYLGEYVNYQQAWLTYKDDESKWLGWSATVTVTFSAAQHGGGGKKPHPHHKH